MAGEKPAIAWPWGAQSEALKERVASAKVLAVGAGGIGCELLKTLVLSGFRNIEVIDLDTIEVSNLNRQFLFRKKHVGHSKASVAAAAVQRFRPDAAVTAHHGNVKDAKYDVGFFRGFDLVLNGLDNLDARRHVNRMCLASGTPLVESGTAGYLGQVTVHVGGKTECFECQPKPVPKTFAVCTIRNTPDKPVHCIEWARTILLPLLFGPPDADTDLNEPPVRAEGEGAEAFAARVFRRVFGSDIAELAATEGMWEGRRPPAALDLDALLPGGGAAVPEAARAAPGTACKALGLEDQHAVWDAAQNAAVFLEATRRFLEQRTEELGAVSFDKDDALAVEFVAGASNLRSLCYGIPLQSLFDAKGMAGNIIHAIATTNAVVSGLIVVEALKLLAAGGDPAACKSTFLRQDLSSRRLLTPVACEPPSAGCSVCGTARLTLRLDTAATTLAELLARVLRGRLAMLEPCLRAGSFSYEEGEDLDASEVALNARWLHVALDALPGGGIRHETLVEVQDQSQALTLALLVVHQAEWDEEEHPEKFTLSGAVPLAKAEPPAAVVAGGNGGDGTAAAAPVPAPRQVEMREGEDGEVELIDSDEEEAAVPAAGAANGKRKAAGGDAAPEMRAGKRARAAGAGGEDVVEMLDG